MHFRRFLGLFLALGSFWVIFVVCCLCLCFVSFFLVFLFLRLDAF